MKPPNVIFVPDEALMFRMIELVAKAPNEDAEGLLIRFCDFLPPKPLWMLEQDKMNQEKEDEEQRIREKMSKLENTEL